MEESNTQEKPITQEEENSIPQEEEKPISPKKSPTKEKVKPRTKKIKKVKLPQVIRPTLLLSKNICHKNIEKMVNKAKNSKVDFRPHFKTHQCDKIGKWFKDFGVEKCTVSSMKMAEYFSKNGFKDITIAIPLNVLEIPILNNMISRKIQVNCLVENQETVAQLVKEVKLPKKINENDNRVGVFIELDTGGRRTGVPINSKEEIKELVEKIEAQQEILIFKGFLTHNGATYNAVGSKEVLSRHEKSIESLKSLQENYKDKVFSWGDTPACSITDKFAAEIQEVRPGNFVFYDCEQFLLGSCNLEDIAVCLACPIISLHKDREELCVYGGAIHLSKDSKLGPDGKPFYGLVAELTDELNWKIFSYEQARVIGISQEHGMIFMEKSLIDSREIGGLLGIIPVHSCLTADCMKEYLLIEEGKYFGMMK